jgi:ChrR Cupin-like domain
MSKPELEFHAPAGGWRRPEGSRAEGIWEQILSTDDESGAYTRLLRFEPGADSSPDGAQAHDFWEEVFIVGGGLTDLTLGETFAAGMYACRPPGMRHGPWRSDSGVLMLEFRYGSASS